MLDRAEDERNQVAEGFPNSGTGFNQECFPRLGRGRNGEGDFQLLKTVFISRQSPRQFPVRLEEGLEDLRHFFRRLRK